ncbi:MAG: hypothetical protein RIC56_12770 [Pseudomonadales bacterium]
MMFAALLVMGCQSAPPSYRDLAEAFTAEEDIDPQRLREAFLRAPDLAQRLQRLGDLEAQALAVVEDEPLKLGSIGSAILDTYVGSLTGHYVLARFYDRVSNAKADFHRAWVERIQADMATAGDGSRDAPYPVMTPVEARMFALSQGLSAVGSIYQTDVTEDVPFSLLLQVRPPDGPLRPMSFDLTGLYQSTRDDFSAAAAAAGPDDVGPGGEFTPFTLIGFLAKQNDSAAQTAVGLFLASPPQNRYQDAAQWLRAASRTGNVVANSLLASIYLQMARGTEDDASRGEAMDQVMENYLHAIALGSADAMYALGVLYLNGHYGEENQVAGVPLLKQAMELGHGEATLFLGHLYYTGEVVDRDLATAREYYAAAADLGNAFARRSYARFLLDRDIGQPGDPRALTWLEELADDGEAESMLLLGNLHARGVGTEANVRRAVRWYKAAVKQAPEDPNIVNEVAWTLAVTDQPPLRRARYARKIMDRLMEANDQARQRPEYLDTWAATYAATGDFDRAVILQQEALDVALSAADYADVVDVLREHLDAFSAGRTVSEAVP